MDITYRSATELAALIEKRKVYSRDLLEHFLGGTETGSMMRSRLLDTMIYDNYRLKAYQAFYKEVGEEP
jgi:hypothetical protein